MKLEIKYNNIDKNKIKEKYTDYLNNQDIKNKDKIIQDLTNVEYENKLSKELITTILCDYGNYKKLYTSNYGITYYIKTPLLDITSSPFDEVKLVVISEATGLMNEYYIDKNVIFISDLFLKCNLGLIKLGTIKDIKQEQLPILNTLKSNNIIDFKTKNNDVVDLHQNNFGTIINIILTDTLVSISSIDFPEDKSELIIYHFSIYSLKTKRYEYNQSLAITPELMEALAGFHKSVLDIYNNKIKDETEEDKIDKQIKMLKMQINILEQEKNKKKK